MKENIRPKIISVKFEMNPGLHRVSQYLQRYSYVFLKENIWAGIISVKFEMNPGLHIVSQYLQRYSDWSSFPISTIV